MSQDVHKEGMSAAAKSLLRMLEEAGDRQRDELAREAEDKISGIRRKAFSEARQRMERAVVQERKRIAQGLARVEAEIETAQRQHGLKHDAKLVVEGRELLKQALTARWQEPGARQAWAGALLAQSHTVVIAREWRIDCPPDWPESERQEAVDIASRDYGARLEVQTSEAMSAGLKLTSGGLLVDMSVDGLLADTERTDSALLALYEDLRRGERS
jgi:hypothetical protein